MSMYPNKQSIDSLKYKTIDLAIGKHSPYLEEINGSGIELLPGNMVVISGYSFVVSGTGPIIVVTEDLYTGKTIADGYSANERVFARHLRAGDMYLARLVPTSGDAHFSADVNPGDMLFLDPTAGNQGWLSTNAAGSYAGIMLDFVASGTEGSNDLFVRVSR